ncbi:TRAP transporter substrate-binding protein [Hoeflea sp.]|uniref:TRAP transporter substrate-binding protein n=1 Tax=Hoeflea sp. TaxID=1940281 RepID=UPI003BAED829
MTMQCPIKAFGGAAIAALLFASQGIAADFTGRLSLDAQEGHPKYIAAQSFAKAVSEGTNGAVEIEIFGNSLLGGEAESAEGMRLGSIQAGIITSSVFASWVPDVQVLDLPFLFRNDEHAIAANSLLTERMGPQFEANGFHLLGFSINGARQLMSKEPIVVPEDVQGKKMRVIQNPIHVALWEQMGANPVPIPAPEVYNAMQTGVVDYFDNTATNYLTFKFFEVGPHYTNLSHIYAMGTWVMSKTFWDSLPAEYQAVVTKAAQDAEASVAPMQAVMDKEALAETVSKGATIHEVSDKEAWRALMAPVWAKFTPTIPNAEATIEAINALK